MSLIQSFSKPVFSKALLLGVGLLLCFPAEAQFRRRINRGFVQMQVTDGSEQAETDETNTGGFLIKKDDQKVVEQFDDFDRFAKKKSWDRAFKSLDGFLAASNPNAMSPVKDGFWIPSRQKVLQNLLELPDEGKAAYQLFNDAKAKQLFDQAVTHDKAGDTADVATLYRKVADQYFISTVGDQAADRLGDCLFESGDYFGAIKMWDQILTYLPGSNLSPVKLQIKKATALARTGRKAQFQQLAKIIKDKFAGQSIKIAGKNVSVEAHLDALEVSMIAAATQPTTAPTTSPTPVATTGPATGPTTGPAAQAFATTQKSTPAITNGPLVFPASNEPVWQALFLDKQLQDKMLMQINQGGWGGQSNTFITNVIPTAIVDAQRAYIGWFGIISAIDLKTGKLIWWTDHYKKIAEKAVEIMQWQIDSSRFNLTLIGDSLYSVSVNLNKINNQEPFRLTCYDPVTGKKKWTSETGKLANWAFIGTPYAADGGIYILAHPKDNRDVHLLSISLDGAPNWDVRLGQSQTANNNRGTVVYPIPVLRQIGNLLYIMTNNGMVIAFDPATKTIQWAYRYEYKSAQVENNWGYAVEVLSPPGAAVIKDDQLFFKDSHHHTMYCLDTTKPSLIWSRAVGEETGFVGLTESRFLLFGLGSETTCISSVDLTSGKMLKSSKLPDGVPGTDVFQAGSKFLVYLSRGFFMVDTENEDVTKDTRIFRGYETEAIGGYVLRSGNLLISVSNQAVTAYDVSGK